MIIKIDFESEEAIYIQLRNQIIMGIATGNAIMVTNMRMGNVRVTHRLMMSARGMATNMVYVAMAATAINALALRNVGLADGNVASLICFQHR